MHTWDEISPEESSWHKLDKSPKEICSNDREFIQSNLKNIKIIIENQAEIIKNLSIDSYPIREKVYHCINYSQSAVLNSAFQNTNADMIILTRPDIKFKNKKILEFLDYCSPNKFYILGNNQDGGKKLSDYSACDTVNIANPLLFSKKLNFFKKNITTFSKTLKKNGWMYEQLMVNQSIIVEVAPLIFKKHWEIKRHSFSFFRDIKRRLCDK